jgi:hypothetical protein
LCRENAAPDGRLVGDAEAQREDSLSADSSAGGGRGGEGSGGWSLCWRSCPLAVELPIAIVIDAPHADLRLGFGVGAGLGATLGALRLAAGPHRIMGTGAQGEKATARQLRPLLKQGRRLFNDIETPPGCAPSISIAPRLIAGSPPREPCRSAR